MKIGVPAYSARRIGAPGRLGLEHLGPGQRVVDRVGVARRERRADEVDRVAVLAVHHHEPRRSARLLEHGQASGRRVTISTSL